MKLFTIRKKLEVSYKFEDGDELISWFRKAMIKYPDNIDLIYWMQDALSFFNHDAEFMLREPKVLEACTKIIQDKAKKNSLEAAKSYAYRGEMKMHRIDRQKDFDRALEILKLSEESFPQKEVKYLRGFIGEVYSQLIRKMISFRVNPQDMFVN